MRRTRWLAVASALLMSMGLATSAGAEEEVNVVGEVKESLARELRRTAFDEPSAREILYSLLIATGQVDPATVFAGTGAGQQFTQLAIDNSAFLREQLELTNLAGSGLTITLTDPDGRLGSGERPLFAASPEVGNENEQQDPFPAEELDGTPVTLDPAVAPGRAVIMVDLDEAAVADAMVHGISAALREEGVLSDVRLPDQTPQTGSTRLDSIKLDSHEEGFCWWKFCDDAEITTFAIGGFNGTARVDVTALHNVNRPGKTYTPNTTIIHWNAYTWSQVDYLALEIDMTWPCSVDSRSLGRVIGRAIKGPASGPSYVPLNQTAIDDATDKKKICRWLPSFWRVNEPDHVDSFDGLSKSSTGSMSGTRDNAHVELSVH